MIFEVQFQGLDVEVMKLRKVMLHCIHVCFARKCDNMQHWLVRMPAEIICSISESCS